MRRRVAVTGLGMISALGSHVSAAWRSVCDGKPGIAPLCWDAIDLPEPAFRHGGLRFTKGAQVRGFEPRMHFDSSRILLLDRFAQFALVAAREALNDSRILLPTGPGGGLGENAAVITGSGMGGQSTLGAGFAKLYRQAAQVDPPLIVPRTMANAGASHISMEFGITGPAYTVSTACCSANHAIGQAFRMVRDGDVELALAGGSEAPFSFGNLKAFEAMRVVSPDTCRPFSKDRRGFILGEGGAMLVLEPLDQALARDATIRAEIVGFGMSADAGHLTHLATGGPVRAMRAALRDAALAPEQIGYLNAHGSATHLNDATETRAIREIFATHADRFAISSTKSLHGHSLGATGAMEAVCTVLALQHGILPPTANFSAHDPACDLDIIPNAARPAQVEYALSNSFAFGGLNAVLAFRAPPA